MQLIFILVTQPIYVLSGSSPRNGFILNISTPKTVLFWHGCKVWWCSWPMTKQENIYSQFLENVRNIMPLHSFTPAQATERAPGATARVMSVIDLCSKFGECWCPLGQKKCSIQIVNQESRLQRIGRIPLVRTASSDSGFSLVCHRPFSSVWIATSVQFTKTLSHSTSPKAFPPARLAQCCGVYQSPSAYSTTCTPQRLNPAPCSLREYGLICMSHALTVSVRGLRVPPSVPCGRPM